MESESVTESIVAATDDVAGDTSDGEKPKQEDGAPKRRAHNTVKETFLDVCTVLISGFIVALGIHIFISSNGFVPGGINGLATIFGTLAGVNPGYFLIVFALPIYVCVFFLVKKRIGLLLILYMGAQSASQILFGQFGMPLYDASNVVRGGEATYMIASLCGGVITGIGFGFMLRRFGASGGTYAIAALIRKLKPAANLIWLSFAMDASVIVIAFFAYSFRIESMIYTFINLFVANKVAEAILQGVKTGYKYEIITDQSNELAAELMEKIGCSVTRVPAHGMYSDEDKSMLVCVIRKRQIGDFQRIIKKYPKTVVFVTQVSETIGGRFSGMK